MQTTKPSSPGLQPESLRDRVVEAVRQRWERPEPSQRIDRPAPAEADKLARQVLDAMLTRAYRVTPFPEDEEYQQLFARVRHWVGKGKAIRIRIGYGPMKNLNTASVSRADWAEFFALGHLCSWHNKVQAIYPPGLRIKIVFDDSTILMANRHDGGHMRSYMNSVARLIGAMGYRSFLVGTMRQSSFAWLFHLGPYQLAERAVRRWESDPANQEPLARMTEYARRNLILPEGVPEADRERLVQEAGHRYRVYNHALQISGFARLGHNLIAMYLDGEQHHVQHRAAFHLTSLGKGQVAQPWQGDGALWDNGHGKLVPLVLTGERRSRLRIEKLAGLDLVPMEGFDAIQVCWDASTNDGPAGGAE